MTTEPAELLLNHLRFTMRNALILLVSVFLLGIVVGWGIGFWPTRRVHAISLIVGASVPAIWFIFAFARTNGLMHHSGLPRRAKGGN